MSFQSLIQIKSVEVGDSCSGAAKAVTLLAAGFDSLPDSCGHFGRELRRLSITFNCHQLQVYTIHRTLVKSD